MLDHIHQRLHVGLPDETTLPNGQKFDLLALALLGVTESSDQLHAVTARLSELKLDPVDYICLKFLLLLNPGQFQCLIYCFSFLILITFSKYRGAPAEQCSSGKRCTRTDKASAASIYPHPLSTKSRESLFAIILLIILS